MTQLMAKIHPNDPVFSAGFFCSFGAVFATLRWWTCDCQDLNSGQLRLNRSWASWIFWSGFSGSQILFLHFFSCFCAFGACFWFFCYFGADFALDRDLVLDLLRLNRRWTSWIPWGGFHWGSYFVSTFFFH